MSINPSLLNFAPTVGVLSYPVVLASGSTVGLRIHPVFITNGCAPFGPHISHVVSVGSEKEMARVDAGRVVTVVANQPVGWDVSV